MIRCDLHKEERGYTLPEVLAALLFFAFGILALYRLQAAVIKSGAHAGQLTQATAWPNPEWKLYSLSTMSVSHQLPILKPSDPTLSTGPSLPTCPCPTPKPFESSLRGKEVRTNPIHSLWTPSRETETVGCAVTPAPNEGHPGTPCYRYMSWPLRARM